MSTETINDVVLFAQAASDNCCEDTMHELWLALAAHAKSHTPPSLSQAVLEAARESVANHPESLFGLRAALAAHVAAPDEVDWKALCQDSLGFLRMAHLHVQRPSDYDAIEEFLSEADVRARGRHHGDCSTYNCHPDCPTTLAEADAREEVK